MKALAMVLGFVSAMAVAESVVKDQSNLSSKHQGRVLMLNKFTAKPGQMDNFIKAQTAEYKRLLGKVKGWKGNRLVKDLDGRHAVNIAVFENMDSYVEWRDSKLFADHLAIIKPFVEKAEPNLYEILYDAGSL